MIEFYAKIRMYLFIGNFGYTGVYQTEVSNMADSVCLS